MNARDMVRADVRSVKAYEEEATGGLNLMPEPLAHQRRNASWGTRPHIFGELGSILSFPEGKGCR